MDMDLEDALEAFKTCGWKEVLSDVPEKPYLVIANALISKAKENKEKRPTHYKVLKLLAMACSMKLDSSSQDKPFKRGWQDVPVLGTSALPEDLSDDAIRFFSRIVGQIDDIFLKAQLADLVWLRKDALEETKRGVEFALIAIDAYRANDFTASKHYTIWQNTWSRAIRLAKQLGKDAGDRLKQMEASIIDAFDAATRQDGCGFLVLHLSELLKSNDLGQTHRAKLESKLKTFAREFKSAGDLRKEKDYSSAADDWSRTTA